MRFRYWLIPGLFLLLGSVGCMRESQRLPGEDWVLYKKEFISGEGRVVDTGNNGISHSEGQGYGLLLAEAYGDRETFDRLWSWTQHQLQVRNDHLFAWRWQPAGGKGIASDFNDASDGDILIAWALARAARQWPDFSYGDEGKAIARDIRTYLLRPSLYGTILLPGAQGFEKPEGSIVNLSYWIFPAFPLLNQIDPSPAWDALSHSGKELLGAARFGSYGLPPDWLWVGKKLAPAPGFPPLYGYDALRIPLYLRWGGPDPLLLKPFAVFWGAFPAGKIPPASINLTTDSSPTDPLSSGGQAIVKWIQADEAGRPLPLRDLAPLLPGQDYYSSSLLMLTKLALSETR